MIRIKRPARAPEVLRTRGVAIAKQHCKEYDGDPRAYRNGKKSFAFDHSIYGHKTVKNALKKAQHSKMRFCESKVSHIAHGDVEHFRPKAGYRRRPNGRLIRPGYYWLAYEWSNLLFCCQICNQRFKGNQFPLADEANRATSHHEAIKGEQPLFLDPSVEDPESVLEFCDGRDGHLFREDGGHPRRKVIIEALGLNRADLAEVRRDALSQIIQLIECRELIAKKATDHPDSALRKKLAEIDRHFKRCVSNSAQYSSMTRALLRGGTSSPVRRDGETTDKPGRTFRKSIMKGNPRMTMIVRKNPGVAAYRPRR